MKITSVVKKFFSASTISVTVDKCTGQFNHSTITSNDGLVRICSSIRWKTLRREEEEEEKKKKKKTGLSWRPSKRFCPFAHESCRWALTITPSSRIRKNDGADALHQPAYIPPRPCHAWLPRNSADSACLDETTDLTGCPKQHTGSFLTSQSAALPPGIFCMRMRELCD
jgi:hypothetical protein